MKRNEEEARYLYAQVASRCLRSAKQTRRVYRIQQTLGKQISTIGEAYAFRSRPFAMYLSKSIQVSGLEMEMTRMPNWMCSGV